MDSMMEVRRVTNGSDLSEMLEERELHSVM